MNPALRMLRRLGRWTGLLMVISFIAACASSAGIKPPNARISAAQTMERRAAQAYAAGDADSAATTYESAALVYESLALAEPMARARLSAARAVAEAGQAEQALAIVSAVLAQPQALSPSTQIVAHGRAAALYLAQGSAPATASTTVPTSAPYLASATAHWQSASALCAQACAEQAALWVLRSRIDLAQGNPSVAVQSASTALAVAQNHTTASTEQANALRARAQAHNALNQHVQTVADAAAALALDQDAGSAARVLSDLQLLAKAHEALGNADQAARFALLATRAQAASRVLQQGAP
jgi:tetratricopeptide (TPR) repeat protein